MGGAAHPAWLHFSSMQIPNRINASGCSYDCARQPLINASVSIPIAIVMPLTVMCVVPGMVLVKAFLARIGEIAAALLSLMAALTVSANGVVEFGLSLFKVLLALAAIVGACRLNCYRSDQNGH
jgi:hypothetical protein